MTDQTWRTKFIADHPCPEGHKWVDDVASNAVWLYCGRHYVGGIERGTDDKWWASIAHTLTLRDAGLCVIRLSESDAVRYVLAWSRRRQRLLAERRTKRAKRKEAANA